VHVPDVEPEVVFPGGRPVREDPINAVTAAVTGGPGGGQLILIEGDVDGLGVIGSAGFGVGRGPGHPPSKEPHVGRCGLTVGFVDGPSPGVGVPEWNTTADQVG